VAPLLKTLIFTVVVPGTVAVLVPQWLLGGAGRFAGGAGRAVAAFLLCVGLAIYLRCAWDFAIAGRGTPAPVDPPRELVVRGLYCYSRNPMYLGVLSLVLGQAALFGSVRLLGYAAALLVTFHLFVVLYEEPGLRYRFGDGYLRYCAGVRRWLPRLHPWNRAPGSPGGDAR
jgi:protein-S-isoprenylcysteine O-methyltransferase Ste14